MSGTSNLDWPFGLSHALIASLPDEDIEELADGFETRQTAANYLMSQSRRDSTLRRSIIERWRMHRPDLISESDFMPVETSIERCEWMVSSFGMQDILIEMITDDKVGWGLTEWTIDNLGGEADRSLFRKVFHELSNDNAPQLDRNETTPRIVIFGGHVRDEQKIRRRIFDQINCDAKWKLFEKRDNGTPDERIVIDAMSNADAVLVITSMISHVVMHMVKRFAQKHDIPWMAIPKATDLHIKSALNELFPNCYPFPKQ
jgi:hypothetical protein